MGTESHHPGDGTNKESGDELSPISAHNGKGKESLSDLYRAVCARALQAHGLSKKKQIKRACQEYEESLAMIDTAEKREGLTERYKELFDKARTEIRRYYRRLQMNLNEEDVQGTGGSPGEKEAPFIRPSPANPDPGRTKAEDDQGKREDVIKIGTAEETPGHDEPLTQEGTTPLLSVRGRGKQDMNLTTPSSDSSSGRTRAVRQEDPGHEVSPDESLTGFPQLIQDEMLDSEGLKEQEVRIETTPEGPRTLLRSESPEGSMDYGSKEKPETEPALIPVLLKRFHLDSLLRTRRRKLVAALVAVLLFLLILGALQEPEKMVVQLPSKNIGDVAEYEVEGTLTTHSETTFETNIGLLSGFSIEFSGSLTEQVNDTATVTDGFDEDHKALEEYLYQDLDMSGTIELVGLNPKLRDGRLITHQTDFTDLRTNTTIRYGFSNIFRITIPTTEPPFSREIHSIDKGTFFTSSAQSPVLLSFLSSDFQEDLLPDKVKEGDSRTNKDYNLKWKACGTKTIAGYDSLAIVVSEVEETEWYDFQLKYWVSSDCPYPTQIEAAGWMDTSKLEGNFFIDAFKAVYGSNTMEWSYKARLQTFEKGEKEIPYRSCFGDHDRTYHEMAEDGFVNWYPEDEYHVPVLFAEGEEEKVSGFSRDFLATDAYEFAMNNSKGTVEYDDVDHYLVSHKNGYAVEGEYFHGEYGEPVWNFTFGYFDKSSQLESLLDQKEDAYNIRLARVQNGTNVSAEILDERDVEITKPDRTNTNMKSVLSLAIAEDIFRADPETREFAFREDAGEQVIDFARVSFRWEANPAGPTAGILSQFLPDDFDVPTLLGYHLIRNETIKDGKETIHVHKDSLISGETGMRIYVRYHRDDFL